MSTTILLALLAGTSVAASPVALSSGAPDIANQSIVEVGALVPAATVPVIPIQPFVDGHIETLTDSQLADLRGGEALVVSNQTLTAITSGNVINGNYTAGNVSLSDQALSNFNGVGNLLINTGAQVSLQTGMNLTINVGE